MAYIYPYRMYRSIAERYMDILSKNLLPDTWVKIPVKRVNLIRAIQVLIGVLSGLGKSKAIDIDSIELIVRNFGYEFNKPMEVIKSYENDIEYGMRREIDLIKVLLTNIARKEGESESEWIKRSTIICMAFLGQIIGANIRREMGSD